MSKGYHEKQLLALHKTLLKSIKDAYTDRFIELFETNRLDANMKIRKEPLLKYLIDAINAQPFEHYSKYYLPITKYLFEKGVDVKGNIKEDLIRIFIYDKDLIDSIIDRANDISSQELGLIVGAYGKDDDTSQRARSKLIPVDRSKCNNDKTYTLFENWDDIPDEDILLLPGVTDSNGKYYGDRYYCYTRKEVEDWWRDKPDNRHFIGGNLTENQKSIIRKFMNDPNFF